MKDRPAGVDDVALVRALGEGWGIAVGSVEFAAVGFGSYHWIVTDQNQRRHFATVDDLCHKGWLGDTCDSAFAGLGAAFDTALALHDRGGLQFVLAPQPTLAGESVRRIGGSHSLALFPFVDGEAGHFGDTTSRAHRRDVVGMLVALHQISPATLPVVAPLALEFSGRDGLVAALNDLDRTWASGPFAEPARAWLASHAGDLERLLHEFDRLVGAVAATDRAPVITHGEPHPGNVMRSHDRLVLLDWDTVGFAPPERDLWLVATASGDEVGWYAEATGHAVSAAAMSLYRLAWDLADVAVYVDQCRSPHQHTQDTQDAWLNLESAIRVEEH